MKTGDVVYVINTDDVKEEYRGRRGVVTSVSSDGVRVKMLRRGSLTRQYESAVFDSEHLNAVDPAESLDTFCDWWELRPRSARMRNDSDSIILDVRVVNPGKDPFPRYQVMVNDEHSIIFETLKTMHHTLKLYFPQGSPTW